MQDTVDLEPVGGRDLAVSIERVEYGGWRNCVRLSNGQIELVATTDVGPRVIHLGFLGGR